MTAAKRILVVDDDQDFLEQTSMVLQAAGYDVVTAAGQVEAEEALLSANPDLCVVDLMMENMDSGFVLCHTIKRLYPDAPVILLTAVRSCTGLDFQSQSA
jgi:CheY-like chemotaxis protein